MTIKYKVKKILKPIFNQRANILKTCGKIKIFQKKQKEF